MTGLSNLEAARTSRRAALEELRDTLAEQLDTATTNVHAQLAAQYRATLADIAALDEEEALEEGAGESPPDEAF